MTEEKIQVRDLRKGDWFWISKILLDEYGKQIKPIGIAIYNCLAEYANQEGYCFPCHQTIADKIGSSVSSVQRGVRRLIKLGIIRKGRRRYSNVYYLLKLDRSDRPTSNKIGQTDWHIGQPDQSDRSNRPTNKNKEQDFINNNSEQIKKLKEIKNQLVEKWSFGKDRKVAREDT